MVGIQIIKGFALSKTEPVDVRAMVADEIARLAITYPYTGLLVKQLDTNQVYEYITVTPTDGGLPTNISGDWELRIKLHTATGVPSGALGTIGDAYIDETSYILYKKTAESTWTALFSISGSEFLVGTGAPDNGNGSNGDIYLEDNGNLYNKAAGVWVFFLNIKGSSGTSDLYATTSTTSIDLSTASDPLSLTIGVGLSYTVGQSVVVASRGTVGDDVTGDVSSYNSGTGVIELINIVINGVGTHTDWDVNLSGATGMQGKGFIHTESDINFNEAKVVSVEAGTWTPISPWSASVLNDTRVSLIAPVSLSGSKTGHSISYDGTTWYDNGRWLGFTGSPGIQGPGYNGTTVNSDSPTQTVYALTPIGGAAPASFTVPKPTSSNGLTGGTKYTINNLVVDASNFTILTIAQKVHTAISFTTPNESFWKPYIEFCTNIRGDSSSAPDRVQCTLQISPNGTVWTPVVASLVIANDNQFPEVRVKYLHIAATPNTTYYYRIVLDLVDGASIRYSNLFGHSIVLIPYGT